MSTDVESDTVTPGLMVGTEPGTGNRASVGQEITLEIAVPVPSTTTSAGPTTTAPAATTPPATSASSTPTTTATPSSTSRPSA